MILFANDWRTHPTAVVHKETTNESFLNLARLYDSMGVKNCLFHLSLLQEELRFVDPHSEDLTPEIKNKIAVELKFNPWYYFREVVRLPASGSPKPVKFKANRGNISMIWSFYNHIDYMLIQPRQTGKSGSTDTVSINLMYFTMSNGKITLITKDDSLRKSNIDRLKGIRDNLPKWTWAKDRTDADNQTELTYNILGNQYVTAVAQKTESGALNVGRGGTSQVTHIDEVPFCANIDITLPAALAAGTMARQFARESGQPYANIFTTTAGKKDTREGAYAYKMLMEGTVWNERYLDCTDEDNLRETLRANSGGNDKNGKSRGILINGTWSYRQLGLTREWLEEALDNSKAAGDDADRDFFNRWTSGSLRSPLSTALNNLIQESERDPQYVEVVKDGYAINWYIPEHEIEPIMNEGYFGVGLDTSEAVGRDGIGLVITDFRDMTTVAAASCNETNLIRFGNFIADLLIRFPRLTLIIEKKSTGQTIIDALLLRLPEVGIDPFKRIFNHLVEDMQTDRNAMQVLHTGVRQRGHYFYDEYKARFGFNTNAANRNLLYVEILPEAARRSARYVRDRKLSMEILGLVEKNGRIDHSSSGHDDMVIAWMLTFWFVMKCSNLNHYGIPASAVMSRVNNASTPEERRNAMELRLQQQYREELESTVDQLKNTTNMYLVSKLEHTISVLNSKIKAMGGEAFSLDALLQEAREARRRTFNKTRR